MLSNFSWLPSYSWSGLIVKSIPRLVMNVCLALLQYPMRYVWCVSKQNSLSQYCSRLHVRRHQTCHHQTLKVLILCQHGVRFQTLKTHSHNIILSIVICLCSEQLAIGVFVALLLIALLIATVVITIMCCMRKSNSARRKNHKLNAVNIGELSENIIFITVIFFSLQCLFLSFVFKVLYHKQGELLCTVSSFMQPLI